jgi:hypothetical protein
VLASITNSAWPLRVSLEGTDKHSTPGSMARRKSNHSFRMYCRMDRIAPMHRTHYNCTVLVAAQDVGVLVPIGRWVMSVGCGNVSGT